MSDARDMLRPKSVQVSSIWVTVASKVHSNKSKGSENDAVLLRASLGTCSRPTLFHDVCGMRW